MRRFTRIADGCSLGAAVAGGAFVSVMVVSITYGSIMRYLRKPTVGIDELAGYLLVGVIFWGLGYALREGTHVTVDVLVLYFSPTIRKVLDFATSVAALVYIGVLCWSAGWLILDSYQLGSKSPSTLQTPTFIPQSLILPGLLVFAIQLIARLYRILKHSP